MSIKIGSNIASLQAQRRLSEVTVSVSSIFEQLSSGLRINKASDDAAGLAVATALNASSRVFGQALRNLNDGISFTNIIEGAFDQLTAITIREQELAEQSANGVFSNEQRQALHAEAEELINEYNRILESSKFNGQSVFAQTDAERELRIQAGYGLQGSIAINRASLNTTTSSTPAEGVSFDFASYSAGTNALRQVRVADFNEDTYDDVVVLGNDNLYYLYLANADGTFQSQTTSSNNQFTVATYLAVGDANGDGNQDILSINTDSPGASRPSISYGGGDGTFMAPVSDFTISTFAATGVLLDDVNNDGRDDLFFWLGNGVSRSLTQLGANPFQNDTVYGVPAAASLNALSLADFNNDNYLDIVATEQIIGAGPFVNVLLNNGSGGYNTAVTFQTAKAFLVYTNATGDFNNDGDADIMTGYGDLLIGNGNGTFEAAVSNTGVGLYTSLRVIDINGDGIDDLIGNDAGGTKRYQINNGDGTFAMAVSLPNIGNQDYFHGDFNGDGKIDFAGASSTNSSLNVYLNTTGESSGSSSASSGAILPQQIDLSTQNGALAAIGALSIQLQQITTEIGAIGAFRSRLETAIAATAATRENYQAAASRLEDVDVASASAQLVRQTIIQQVGASILAQANQQPQLALTLLR